MTPSTRPARYPIRPAAPHWAEPAPHADLRHRGPSSRRATRPSTPIPIGIGIIPMGRLPPAPRHSPQTRHRRTGHPRRNRPLPGREAPYPSTAYPTPPTSPPQTTSTTRPVPEAISPANVSTSAPQPTPQPPAPANPAVLAIFIIRLHRRLIDSTGRIRAACAHLQRHSPAQPRRHRLRRSHHSRHPPPPPSAIGTTQPKPTSPSGQLRAAWEAQPRQSAAALNSVNVSATAAAPA